MKMRTKKCGAVALAAVLLIAAALVTSCIDPIDLGGLTVPQSGAPAEFTPTYTPVVYEPSDPVQEVGYLQLNILTPENGARTTLPTIGTVTFDQFSVFISEASGKNVANYTSGATITLDPGPYNIRVVGLVSTVAKAAGVIPEFTLAAGSNLTRTVTLKEIVTEGTGTFEWTLTNPAGNAGATVTPVLTPLSTNAATVTMGGLTGSETVNAGYYLVETTMSETGKKSVKVIEALHIYAGFTSTYTATLPVLKPNVYAVTFMNNIGTGGGTQFGATQNVNHGGFATMPSPDPTHSNNNMKFTGWYTEIGCENVFEFDEENSPYNSVVQIIKPYTLYAGWLDESATDGTVAITVVGTPSYSGDKPLQLSGVVSSVNRNGTVTVTVSVTNTTDYPLGVTWTADDAQTTGYTLTLDFGLVANKIVGVWRVSVVGMDTGNIPYSTSFDITVNDGP